MVSVDRIRPGLICVQSQWNTVRFSREQASQPSRFGNAVNATQFQSQFNTFKFTTIPTFGSTQPSTGISPMSSTFGGFVFHFKKKTLARFSQENMSVVTLQLFCCNRIWIWGHPFGENKDIGIYCPVGHCFDKVFVQNRK